MDQDQDQNLPFGPEDRLDLSKPRGEISQLYPEITCEHARQLMDKIENNTITVGERVVLAYHQADYFCDHDATCIFHEPDAKERINIDSIFIDE